MLLNFQSQLKWVTYWNTSTTLWTWTYHPNIGSSLQLCIDPITTKVRVHLQTCWLSKVNIGLQANSCNNVIGFYLQGGAEDNQWLISHFLKYTELVQKLGPTNRPSFSWISNLSSLLVTDFTKASEMTLTPSRKPKGEYLIKQIGDQKWNDR